MKKITYHYRSSFSYLNILPSRANTYVYSKDVLNYASTYGFIKQGGSWFSALDNEGNELYKCQGGPKMAKYIELNPEFYITLKLQVYSKIYEPYEFYYHFEKLKRFLKNEFEAMKKRAEEKIKYTELDQEELEILETLKESVYPLDSKTINNYLTERQIESALFELKRYYDDDEIELIKKRNN